MYARHTGRVMSIVVSVYYKTALDTYGRSSTLVYKDDMHVPEEALQYDV